MNRLARSAESFMRIAALLSGVVLVLVAIGAAVNAILRSVIGSGIPAMVEVSGPVLAVAIFLALPFATIVNAHVKVILLTDQLPARLNRLFKVAGALSVSAMCAAVGYWMYFLTVEAAEIGMTTLASPVKVAPFMGVATAGAWLASIAGLISALRELRGESDE